MLTSDGECMNCFTGTSMMISEQWKAVCCRRLCVERNWILFSCEVLTALPIQQVLGIFAQWMKASNAFIVSICLSVYLTARISALPTRRVDVKFDLWDFMKMCQENTKLIEKG
jgi:hypothetical protein